MTNLYAGRNNEGSSEKEKEEEREKQGGERRKWTFILTEVYETPGKEETV